MWQSLFHITNIKNKESHLDEQFWSHVWDNYEEVYGTKGGHVSHL